MEDGGDGVTDSNRAEHGAPCGATLRHAHGVSPCGETGPHAEHRGRCDSCWDDGDYPWLTWTGEGRTEWPI